MLALAPGFLALIFVYAVDDDTDCPVPASMPEQTNWRYQISPWPPGGDCVYELPNGIEVVRDKPLPWFEWIFLALCAGVCVLVSWAWGAYGWPYTRPGRRSSSAGRAADL